MPIAPTALTLTCPKCQWMGVYAPRSDCLITPPWHECPECGHAPLTVRPADPLTRALSTIGAIDRR